MTYIDLQEACAQLGINLFEAHAEMVAHPELYANRTETQITEFEFTMLAFRLAHKSPAALAFCKEVGAGFVD